MPPAKRRAVRRVCVVDSFAFAFFVIGEVKQTGGGILTRVLDSTSSCSSRLILWSNVLHLIAKKPLWGWGWGELSWAHFQAPYSGDRFCEILDNAHNLPLHLAVELGLPTAIAICGAIFWLLVHEKPWAERRTPRKLAWSVIMLVGLHSMFEYPLWFGPFQLAIFLSLYLLTHNSLRKRKYNIAHGLTLLRRESEVGSRGALRRASSTFVLAIALLFYAYVGWDYWRVTQLYLPPLTRAAAYQEDTYEKVKGTWLFQNQVQFAHLSTTTLDQGNAAERNAQAKKLLHFSPEPRVVEAVIESAVMLGKNEEALYYLQRYKAAFPESHERWAAALARDKAP